MSQTVIDHSPEIKQLRDEGYSVFVQDSHLVIDDIPYLNASKELKIGRMISTLTLTGNKVLGCPDHTVYFDGEAPHSKDGNRLDRIINGESEITHANGIISHMRFSSKPTIDGKYKDCYQKMTFYIEMVSGPARAIFPESTPRQYKAKKTAENESVHVYSDTNSSRACILPITQKLEKHRIGIIGLGGTGSYILDYVTKTPVAEIRIIDGDEFHSHNAYRTPSAAHIDEVNEGMKKVNYLKNKYSNMHKNISSFPCFISKGNLSMLDGLDFVFVSIDSGSTKAIVFEHLEKNNIPYIDVGMGLEITTANTIRGSLMMTSITNPSRHGLKSRIHLEDDEEGIYGSNIQICELNGMNASMAVIAWKHHIGFYHSAFGVGQMVFNLDTQSLIKVEDAS